MSEQRQCYGGAGVQQEESETCANHQPDLSGGERFHVPLISRNQNEQVDESEETIINFYHSGDEAGQSPDDQYGRGQRQVVFAAERLQSLGKEGEQRQEYGVGGGVPPQAHAQWHGAFRHEFHTEIGSVEHEVERYEDKAPEQELAFHDPHAFQVGFDGLFLVEEEPCGDGEEDDHADLASAGHDELEEDPFRSQGEFQHVVAVMDDEVMGEDHEHRDDAQQLDAGISPPPHLRFGNVPVRRVWRLRGCRSPRPVSSRSQFSSSLWSLFPPNPTYPDRLYALSHFSRDQPHPRKRHQPPTVQHTVANPFAVLRGVPVSGLQRGHSAFAVRLDPVVDRSDARAEPFGGPLLLHATRHRFDCLDLLSPVG